jgi:copper chaperone CopZ
MKQITIYTAFLSTLLTLAVAGCSPKIEHAKSVSTKVYGNCGTCKKTIETAANVKGVSRGTWDQNTQMLTLSFDSMRSTLDEILKRVAYAGYDNEKFLAPDDAYTKLEACCKYDRPVKNTKPDEPVVVVPVVEDPVVPVPDPPVTLAEDPFGAVYSAYFAVKDALVKTDGKTTSTAASELMKAIDAVKNETLSAEHQTLWAKYKPLLALDAEHINGTTKTDHQREHFSALSGSMYAVMKAAKPGTKVYLDHCPMAFDGKGADWLSKDKEIKNPYYGSQMLGCGSVKETIQ